jgi:hypothetical protein
MRIDNKQILPPAQWQEFEKMCRALFKAEWNATGMKRNGREGYPQHGVDV